MIMRSATIKINIGAAVYSDNAGAPNALLTSHTSTPSQGTTASWVGRNAEMRSSTIDMKARGKNYKTGKAFHIYRPLITDGAGKTVWGELNIDLTAE